MSGKTAAILGATGMIGQHLLAQALADPYFDKVVILVRRPYEQHHPKLQVKVIDFKDTESFRSALTGAGIIFSCIGTTQKKVQGDEKLYREIDFDIPVTAARLGKEIGAHSFIMVSSVGANHHSRNFYLRLKGETEKAVIDQGIAGVHIMRPSQLLGKREEFRLSEKILNPLMKAISGLFKGSLQKFKAIDGEYVAKAMIRIAKSGTAGVFRYTYAAIMKEAGNPLPQTPTPS